jgi:hypothetical protein
MAHICARFDAVGLLFGLVLLSSCSGAEVPILSSSSPLVDFGEVVLGESSEATLMLSNQGSVDAEIVLPIVSGDDGADFVVVDAQWPVTLAAGASTEIALSFTPTRSGTLTAAIEISAGLASALSGGAGASASSGASLAVGLVGTGLQAGDDDDSSGDDDDTAGDDDDTAGDDDDTAGDDDDTAGDDDDTTGDDDDTAGDDDDDDDTAGPDEDGDGYTADTDGGTDCDDSDPTVNPSGLELCDGVDNDCDGDVDDDPIDGLTWYLDADSDGYGGQLLTQDACSAPPSYVENADDCDDLESGIYPGATELCNGIDDDCDGAIDDDAPAAQTWYLDNDGDGVGGFWLTQEACAMPQGYAGDSSDCDDTNAAIYPTAPELCDGFDNDCDGALGSDEIDDDGDGVTECSQDCDDADPLRFPGSAELCDGIDNDCDATTAAVGGEVDADNDLALACEDCDDDPVTGPAAYPGAAEVCDGADNDCDGSVDVGATDESTWYFDADGDSHGGFLLTQQACSAPTGYVASSDDCAELDANSYPGAPEICDGVDNDCNGQIDDGSGAAGTVWYGDSDADGYGDPGTVITACGQPIAFVSNSLDCDDGNAATNPTSYEICDGVDNNCTGGIDEAGALDAEDWYIDNDGDGYGVVGVSIASCDQPTGYADNFADCDDDLATGADNYPGNSETCDGLDQDCDGEVDEDFDQDTDGAFDEDDAGCASTYAASVLDCDDSDGDSQPGGTEQCGDGIDQDCDGSDLVCFSTVVFSNCGQSGRDGPSQTECENTYFGTDLAGAVTVNSGIQQWTVPGTATYTITALGAAGGISNSSTTSLGASIQGDVALTAGEVLSILVGQQGEGYGSSGDQVAAGGGGTFVISGSTPLIIAGGGAGVSGNSIGSERHATVSETGNTSCSGDSGGNSGGGGNCSTGGGGGGFSGDGANCGYDNHGRSYLNGGRGGFGDTKAGGFGGGGGGGNDGAGGGGGYSGGGGSSSSCGWGNGGGGGSFNSGSNQSSTGPVNSGHGQVTISIAN